jgi:hypothetical protein
LPGKLFCALSVNAKMFGMKTRWMSILDEGDSR